MKNIHKNILHLEPEHGLLNDPNGLIYYDEKYYVFHQWNRFELNHSYKEWGLFTSKDLLHWVHEGSAILPDSIKDKDGVYSGGSVVKDNKLHIFYTGNTKKDTYRKSYQCHAVMEDKYKFVKQAECLETPNEFTEHYRDPYITKINDQSWRMLVGSQTSDFHGAITSYTSTDLTNWQYQGIYYRDQVLDEMCECPNLVDFDQQKMLLVCPQKRELGTNKEISSYSGYLLGEEKKNHFVTDNKIQKLDEGFDFYAPQVLLDKNGRKIMLAWMSRMNEDQEKKCPTREFGYIHCLTLPREILLKNGHLYQKPLQEYRNALRMDNYFEGKNIKFKSSSKFNVFEIKTKSKFEMTLFNQNIKLKYTGNALILSRKDWATNIYESKTIEINNLRNINFYCDRSALEIFINNGEKVMSMRYFCFDKNRENIIQADSNVDLAIKHLEL